MIGRLEAAGVQVRPNMAGESGRLNGLAYVLNGITVTSKALGRGYTLQNLQKRGISYVPARDAEALRRLADNSPAHPQKEIVTMETASISPVTPAAPGPHLAMASGTLPSIHRSAGGTEWWPQTESELSALGLDVEWWRYQPRDIGAGAGIAEPRLLIGLRDGAAVALTRDSVSATRVTPETEAAMVALAERRGWTSVTVSGDAATKERLARELLGRGVSVTNPELQEYCSRVRRELAAHGAPETAISVQSAAPARPKKLGLFGWREKRHPAPEPVKPAAEAPVQAEQPMRQVDDTASPTAPIPTADELEGTAQKAGQGDVDGVMSYRHRIDAYRLSELATDDQRMRAYYRDMLDADERGYPWRGPARDALQALEREIQSGNLDDAHDKLYDAWLAMEPEELQLIRRYNERVDELREERKHEDVRPS